MKRRLAWTGVWLAIGALVVASAHLGGFVPRAAHPGPDKPLGAARRGVLLLA